MCFNLKGRSMDFVRIFNPCAKIKTIIGIAMMLKGMYMLFI